jgi:hypothetical protein
LDFTRAWRDPFLALLALDEIENSPLPVGQHPSIIVRTAGKASSNEHLIFLAFRAKRVDSVPLRMTYNRTRSTRNWHQR